MADIEDFIIKSDDNDWVKNLETEKYIVYQHKQHKHIFRDVFKNDNRICILDDHRYISNINNKLVKNTISRIVVDKLFPISLPYRPFKEKYVVYENVTKVDQQVNLVHVEIVYSPSDGLHEVDLYFIEKNTVPFEITRDEYINLKNNLYNK